MDTKEPKEGLVKIVSLEDKRKEKEEETRKKVLDRILEHAKTLNW